VSIFKWTDKGFLREPVFLRRLDSGEADPQDQDRSLDPGLPQLQPLFDGSHTEGLDTTGLQFPADRDGPMPVSIRLDDRADGYGARQQASKGVEVVGDCIQVDDRKGRSIDPVGHRKRRVHAPSLVTLHPLIVNLDAAKKFEGKRVRVRQMGSNGGFVGPNRIGHTVRSCESEYGPIWRALTRVTAVFAEFLCNI